MEMIPHHGKTQQFIQFKIPLKGWAIIVFATGIFTALLIVLATIAK
jgi:hypothetical protein